MKRNKKLTILALSVMLVMTLAATVISFSLANLNNNKSNGIDDTPVTLAEGDDDVLTNIDYIIKGTEPADSEKYKIVEIGSKNQSTATAFGTFAASESEGFKNYVINAHRTIPEDMEDGRIEYKYFYSGMFNENTTGYDEAACKEALAYVASADFIYISAADKYSIAAGNDFSEDLYNVLHVAAVGDYKPIVIDKPSTAGSSGSDIDDADDLTVATLVNEYLLTMGTQYNAYYWDAASGVLADDYFSGTIGSGSLYVGLSGKSRASYWLQVKPNEANTDAPVDMSQVLIISNGTSGTFSNGPRTQAAFTDATTVTSLYKVSDSTTITPATNQMIYKVDANAPIYANGYHKRYALYKPEYILATEVTLDELAADADFDFAVYDMVIYEDNCGSKVISPDLYKRLVSLMYSKKHTIYNKNMTGTVSNTPQGGGTVTDDLKATNYYELYQMVATDKDVARYANIMLTDQSEINVIATSKNSQTCKIFADLINASSFRGIGGPGSASTTFTVLEIQPCYPIDTVIAEKNGGYYTNPADVLNNKTREQLGIGVTVDNNGTPGDPSDDKIVTDASLVDATTPEYYAWELSEAKIAEMFDKDVNEVKVVHMSSEEFAGSKDAVLGNYDLVYIGGNTTAFKDYTERQDFDVLYGGYNYAGANQGNIVKLPMYIMYANAGAWAIGTSDVEQGPVQGGTLRNAAYGHTSADTFVNLNGNDFSYVVYSELIKYIEADMPVVISKSVTDTYDLMSQLEEPTLQNNIDPNTFVYKFLQNCEGKDNVLWGFDPTWTENVDNDGGRLGDTATGYVEVFQRSYEYDETKGEYVLVDLIDEKGNVKKDANGNAIKVRKKTTQNFVGKEDILELYDDSSQRPKLAVTSMPAVYNVYDPSTKTMVTNGKPVLDFKFDVTGVSSDYTVNLYADYDKNSIFAEGSIFLDGELLKTQSGGNSISIDLSTITGKYDGDYTGPVYWKLEIVDNASGAAVSTAQLAYIESKGSDKKEINVLQILPDENIHPQAYGQNSWVSLIFCTECQRAFEILKRNPGHVDSLAEGEDNYYKLTDDDLTNGCHKGVYTGRHEHRFGIVRYDSATGTDDWYYNYADDISDMFDVNIDIMTSRDFETAVQTVNDDLADELSTRYGVTSIDQLTDIQVEALKADLDIAATEAGAKYEAYVTLDEVLADLYNGAPLETLTADQHAELKTTLAGETKALALAEYNLKWFIYGIKDKHPGTDACTMLNNIYDTGMYSDFLIATKAYGAEWYFDDYKTYYEAYAKALDTKLDLKDAYDKANRLANYENWLLGCYQSVIIGPAESFCGDDIKTEAALDVIEGYVAQGGHTLLFHDTLSKYSDAGAYRLTDVLLDYYGMDKYHAEYDSDTLGDSTSATVTTRTGIDANNLRMQITTTEYGTKEYNNLNPGKWYQTLNFSGIDLRHQNVGNKSWDTTNVVSSEGTITIKLSGLTGENSALYNGTIKVAIGDWNNGFGSEVDCVIKDGAGEVKLPNYVEKETTSTYSYNNTWYLPYKLKSGYTADKYLLPNLSTHPVTDNTRYFSWNSEMKTVWTSNPVSGRYYSMTYAYTDSLKLSEDDNLNMSPYKYADVDWHAVTANGYQHIPAYASLGANKASKTNEGLVTMFPFTLSDELNIAPTHAQAYALDLNNDKVSVWYTIGGGDNNKTGSEIQAATPHDATDNYFIYSVGNLNYCGAGHCKVTGPEKDNNDERMLYINIICNSVTNTPVTDIQAFDYTSTDDVKTNNEVKKVGSEYVLKIDEEVTHPSFSFMYTLPTGVTAKDIKVYYDLDGLTGYDPNSKDVLIKQYTGTSAPAGKLVFVPKDLQDTDSDEYINLELKPEYLTNGKYVYIVIQVTDSNGKTTYLKIKVEYKDKLYNLT